MDKRRYLRVWLLTMARLERKLRVEQARNRNAMIRNAAKVYNDRGQVPSFLLAAHKQRIRRTLEDHYRRTIPVFSRMALQGVKSRRIEKKEAQTIWEALLAEWIGREALRKATLIADTDRDDVTAVIDAGLREGTGTEEIARNIRKVTASTPWRAATIARTETHAAATFGSIETVRQAEEELDIKMIKEWLPTGDSRTRADHRAMRGKKVGVDEKFNVDGVLMDRPGDPSAPASQTVNCLHPDSVLESGHIKFMTRHWYEGAVVRVKTSRGNELTVTPNHPVLTRRGWIGASALNESDSVISRSGCKGVSLGVFDIKNIKATAEEVFNTLAIKGVRMGVVGVAVDFHGDIPNGDIDVIRAARKLRSRFVAAICEPLYKLVLAKADFAKGRLLAFSLLYSSSVKELLWLVPHGVVGLTCKLLAFFRACISHSLVHPLASISRFDSVVGEAQNYMRPILANAVCQEFDRLSSKKSVSDFSGVRRAFTFFSGRHGFRDFSELDSRFGKSAVKGLLINTIFRRKVRDRCPGFVFEDKVVEISHEYYSGYVYNLETHNGYYTSNGIVQHNCRCALIYEEAEEE